MLGKYVLVLKCRWRKLRTPWGTGGRVSHSEWGVGRNARNPCSFVLCLKEGVEFFILESPSPWSPPRQLNLFRSWLPAGFLVPSLILFSFLTAEGAGDFWEVSLVPDLLGLPWKPWPLGLWIVHCIQAPLLLGEAHGVQLWVASLEPGSMDGAFLLLAWRTALDPCVREWNNYLLTRGLPQSNLIPLKTVQPPCWRVLPAHLQMWMLRLREGKGLAQAPELGLGPTPDTCLRTVSSNLHFNYAMWKEFHQALPRSQKAENQESEEVAKRMYIARQRN